MTDVLNTKLERITTNTRKVTVQDKMDIRDCARLLDYYRMRIGKLKYIISNHYFWHNSYNFIIF